MSNRTNRTTREGKPAPGSKAMANGCDCGRPGSEHRANVEVRTPNDERMTKSEEAALHFITRSNFRDSFGFWHSDSVVLPGSFSLSVTPYLAIPVAVWIPRKRSSL